MWLEESSENYESDQETGEFQLDKDEDSIYPECRKFPKDFGEIVRQIAAFQDLMNSNSEVVKSETYSVDCEEPYVSHRSPSVCYEDDFTPPAPQPELDPFGETTAPEGPNQFIPPKDQSPPEINSGSTVEMEVEQPLTPEQPLMVREALSPGQPKPSERLYNMMKNLFVKGYACRFEGETLVKGSPESLVQSLINRLIDESVALQTQAFGFLIMRDKRFDQFEKKWHSNMKSLIYQEYKTSDRISKEVAEAKMQHDFKIAKQEDFQIVLGSELKSGLCNDAVTCILNNKLLFDQIFSVKSFTRQFSRMCETSLADVHTNILNKLETYVRLLDEHATPEKLAQAEEHFFRDVVDNGRYFKKPFTAMENLWSAKYFNQKFITKLQTMLKPKNRPESSGFGLDKRREQLLTLMEIDTMLNQKMGELLWVIPDAVYPLRPNRVAQNFLRIVTKDEFVAEQDYRY